MPNIEELEKQEEALQGKITDMASYQVSLSKDIEMLKPALKELEDTKAVLMQQIGNLEAAIKQRESERNESLNQRDTDLRKREEINSNAEKVLTKSFDELELAEKNLKFRAEQAAIVEKDNAQMKADLDKLSSIIDEKDKKFTAKENALQEESLDLAHVRSDLEEREKALEENEKSLFAKEVEIQNTLSNVKELEKHWLQMNQSVEEKNSSLDKSAANMDTLSHELSIRQAQSEKNNEIHAAQLNTIQEENKKIQVAWLKINKAIQDKQLNLDLETLKK